METLSILEAAYKLGADDGYKLGWKACEDNRRNPINQEIADKIAKIIISTTCEYYGMDWGTISMCKRDRVIVYPRQVCMYFLHKYSPLSLKDIGELFLGKDHTTVIHAKNAIKGDIETNPNICHQVLELEGLIQEAIKGMEVKIIPKRFPAGLKKFNIKRVQSYKTQLASDVADPSRPAAEYSNNGHLNLIKKYA